MAERKRITPRKKISVNEQEKLLEALQQQDEKKIETVIETAAPRPKAKKAKPKLQRVTVDFPQDMYEAMKEETQMNGQTLRGFIVALVRNHLRSREDN